MKYNMTTRGDKQRRLYLVQGFSTIEEKRTKFEEARGVGKVL